ncbi:MAG: hypothetical protein WBQ17_03280 [Rhizomicrobium sp.]
MRFVVHPFLCANGQKFPVFLDFSTEPQRFGPRRRLGTKRRPVPPQNLGAAIFFPSEEHLAHHHTAAGAHILLKQPFPLKVGALADESKSPLRKLEQMTGRKLA